MLLVELVNTSGRVARTRARGEKIEHLTTCVRRLAPEEIEIGVGYLMGVLRQGRLGIGPAVLRDAAPGAAAPAASLMLSRVDAALQRTAEFSGAGSAARRRALLGELLAEATREEQDFLVRLLLGELRQGALEGVMTEAVARAAGLAAGQVRRATMLAGQLTVVARAALLHGAVGLERFSLQPLQPVRPMLAQAAEDLTGALDQLDRAALEFKMDGARVQVHKAGPEVKVFTRRLKDVTAAVPEIVELVGELPAETLILDGETLALREDGFPQPFQVTMRRFGRKLDVAGMREQLPLSAFFFDCLHLDGEDLIDRSGEDRNLALTGLLSDSARVPRIVARDAAVAQQFLERALGSGHEGIMAKSLAAPYQAGSRGSSWLKLKPVHTLDLVVLAAEWGHGRRRGWLSNLHLGARNPATGEFVMLGKTFKGLTDRVLQWQTGRLLELEVARDAYTVYVKPELVVEIACNDIQASPHYPAGMALRFARVKQYRPDKRVADADTIDAVRRLYQGARG